MILYLFFLIRDIINILNRRAPYIRLKVFDTQIQGENAIEDITNTINKISINLFLDHRKLELYL